jgi:hypothetical protein
MRSRHRLLIPRDQSRIREERLDVGSDVPGSGSKGPGHAKERNLAKHEDQQGRANKPPYPVSI